MYVGQYGILLLLYSIVLTKVSILLHFTRQGQSVIMSVISNSIFFINKLV